MHSARSLGPLRLSTKLGALLVVHSEGDGLFCAYFNSRGVGGGGGGGGGVGVGGGGGCCGGLFVVIFFFFFAKNFFFWTFSKF